MDPRISRSRVKGFLTTDGRRTVNGAGEEVILAGVGLGNWLLPEGYMWKCGGPRFDRPHRIEQTIRHLAGSAYAEDFWRRFRDDYITRRDVEMIAEAGFNSVRIPFNHRVLLADEPGIDFLESGFALIERLLGWCEEFSLYAVIDMHGAPGGQTGSNIDDCVDDIPRLYIDAESRARAIEIWREIARRFKDRAIVAAYDLLNEPMRTDLPGAPNTEYLHPELTRFYDDCIAAIREIDPVHALSLEGAHWASRTDTFYKKFDPRQIIHFHRYGNLPGEEIFDEWVALGAKFDSPIWLGESGENSLEWYGAVFPQALRRGFGFNFWTWKRMAGNPVPLEIKQPAGWGRIMEFCKGGSRPSYAEAQQIFDEYLENIKAENCAANPAVAAALLRRGAPQRLMAADFDCGAGSCSGRRAGAPLLRYRSATGMRIKPRSGMVYAHGPGFQSGWEKLCLHMESGEWAQYTFGAPGAAFSVEIAGETSAPGAALRVTETRSGAAREIPLPASGAFDAAAAFSFAEAPEEIVIRVEMTGGTADLHTVGLTK